MKHQVALQHLANLNWGKLRSKYNAWVALLMGL